MDDQTRFILAAVLTLAIVYVSWLIVRTKKKKHRTEVRPQKAVEPRAQPTGPTDRRTIWQMIGIGTLMIVAGAAGGASAESPPPPHSTGPSMYGWPARWFAAGVGWIGLMLVVFGVDDLLGFGRATRRATRRVGLGSLVMALACWAAWIVSMFLRKAA